MSSSLFSVQSSNVISFDVKYLHEISEKEENINYFILPDFRTLDAVMKGHSHTFQKNWSNNLPIFAN